MKPKVIMSGYFMGIKSESDPYDSFSSQIIIGNIRIMLRNLMFLGFLIKMTSGISLVEILLKNNVNEARCQAQCLEAESPGERDRCVSICWRPTLRLTSAPCPQCAPEIIPRPREWRGEQQEDREARIQHSTSIVAAVVLALLGVCVLLFSVASVLVRLRARSGEEEEAPDLPYSPPVKRALVTESQSEALTAQPRVITIIEEEEYEEVDLTRGQRE